MVKLFNNKANVNQLGHRALQLWQILIGLAHNRQTITYGELGKLIGIPRGVRVLARMLGYVMFYCSENKLPPLTALVVGKKTGQYGDGMESLKDPDRQRERVFGYDWYGVIPPTPAEFKEAFTIGYSKYQEGERR